MYLKHTRLLIMMFIIVSLSFLYLTCGSDKTNSPTPEKPGFTYQAVEYVITQSDGREIILRSRGKGNGINDAYFDIYIEDSVNSTIAFRGDPVWFSYPMQISQAITQTSHTNHKRGNLPTSNSFYFLDINGGSDQGGVSYHFHTGTKLQPVQENIPATREELLLDSILVNTEVGGSILDTNGAEINNYGAFFWDGTSFITIPTAAHLYFTRSSDHARLTTYHTDTIDAVGSGSQVIDLNGDSTTIIQNTYTYTVEKSSTSDDAENLGSSFPIDFEIQVSGLPIAIPIRVARFTPKLLSEQEH